MPGGLILGSAVFLLVVFSVRERVRLRLYREKDWGGIGESRISPLSQALANLVGVAGGIYLSLVVLVSFLEVQLPSRLQIGPVSVEPLAVVSFSLALLQPFMARILYVWRKT
ncbi:MAG: hypothetical protein C4589_00935 [Peptococcaceae bacterium]|nr:MAG: hypothetical protein C4589_00935 [Peptococcaceae bacterium]